jgi:cytochrome c oxidase assembly protein subunit 15
LIPRASDPTIRAVPEHRARLLRRFAVATVVYNLAVIVWGAFVRATGSGAGCGDHWPMCNGEVLPRPRTLEMFIEFTHRITSGISLVGVAALLAMAFRWAPKGHPVRRGAVFSGALIVSEALLGAGLVLFRLVAGNTSMTRAWFGAAHLVNTFALVAALTLTAWWSYGHRRLDTASRPGLTGLYAAALAATLAVAVTGSIAALGDTLFPARSFAEGYAQDFSSGAHLLLRLRIWHPVVALGATAVVLAGAVAGYLATRRPATRWLGVALVGVVAVQLCLGLANVFLLAPVPLQLAHLLVADVLWVTLVLLAASALEREPAAAA